MKELQVETKYDIKANLDGGGFTGQAEALRLAIARALVKINEEDKTALKHAGLLTRDAREVERRSQVNLRLVVTSNSASVNVCDRRIGLISKPSGCEAFAYLSVA